MERATGVEWQEFSESAPVHSERWASTDRGWAFATVSGCEQSPENRCVGFYTKSSQPDRRGRFFARAYVITGPVGQVGSMDLGQAQFRNSATAKAFVERLVLQVIRRSARKI